MAIGGWLRGAHRIASDPGKCQPHRVVGIDAMSQPGRVLLQMHMQGGEMDLSLSPESAARLAVLLAHAARSAR